MLDRPNTRSAWEARAAALKPESRAFIDGAYVPPPPARPSRESLPSTAASSPRSPIAARPTSTAPSPPPGTASRSACGATPTPQPRRKCCCASPNSSANIPDEIALLETLDVGKPIANALAVDVPFCANCIQYYAEFADKLYDEIAPAAGPDELALVRKEPLGVIGAIVPWNYPLIIAAWKIGPALLAGNSVVLKPAEQSSLASLSWRVWRLKPGCRRACSTSCPDSARRRARRWRCTTTWT